ncbi:16S rRNA (cytosine(1402)-N(4))-methyltransferase RsmH [bacterium]|nr:16S rRNA (cytosine(1402)-N(4))-methyltransferase RsmH [bacterium]
MLHETLTWLNPQPGQTIVDMTVGLAGHGREIIKRIGPDGRYVGLEWDPETYALAQQALADEPNVILVNESFLQLPEVLAAAGVGRVDGVVLDAGVNLFQLTAPERSMAQDSEVGLDMRMDRRQGVPAEVLVNEASEAELRQILRATLNEREARSIARAIVRARTREAIRTTRRLSEVILSTLSPQARRKGRQPAPALLAFRVAVNRELENLEQGIRLAVDALRPGGRLAVISFHSAEHRVCRAVFRSLAHPCTCPPRLPCVCGLRPRVKILTPKPPGPDEESLRLSGPTCRSARMHVLEAL